VDSIVCSDYLQKAAPDVGKVGIVSSHRKGCDMSPELTEYLAEIREQVCSRCIDRPPGGPPCAPLGKRCGLEINLPWLVYAVHHRPSTSMDSYIQSFREDVCTDCAFRATGSCPCPISYLLPLAVAAIESVDERRKAASLN
jgi:hypothetical protein